MKALTKKDVRTMFAAMSDMTTAERMNAVLLMKLVEAVDRLIEIESADR